jgi:chromosome segregation ATPase
MNDTPRTDAAAGYCHESSVMASPSRRYGEEPYVPADFARQLERELNEAKSELQKRHDLLSKAFGQPRGEDGECKCAYCRRDFEAIAEHAAILEMDCAGHETTVNQLCSELSEARANQKTADVQSNFAELDLKKIRAEVEKWHAMAKELADYVLEVKKAYEFSENLQRDPGGFNREIFEATTILDRFNELEKTK